MEINQSVKNVVKKTLMFPAHKSKFIQNSLSIKNKVRLQVKLSTNEYKEYTLHGIYPELYKEYSKAPVDENKVVFLEVRHPMVTNSYQVIYDKLVNEYNFEVHVHFLKSGLSKKEEHRARCIEMIKDVATAKYVFIDDGLNAFACLPLRKETIVAQLWHGCGAFKKFGFSTAELIFGNTREEMLEFPNHKNYTYVPVSSPEVEWAYIEAFGLEETPEVVKGVGVSRTDIFYDEEFKRTAREKFYRLMPSAKDKKVILYAPTFRGRVAKATMPDMLDVGMFNEALSDDYVLVFKHHPLVKKPPIIDKSYSDFAKDFTSLFSIEELLCVSDICISDYSSLVFEYSIFEKPMIFYAFDIDEYNDWRGFYYDYDELTPGPVFKTNLEMIDYIQNIDERFDKARVQQFRNKFMSSCDGHATERILSLVFGKALETHLIEGESAGIQYHRIPSADKAVEFRKERVEKAKAEKAQVSALYNQLSKKPIEKNKVVYISTERTYAAKRLISKLSKKDIFVQVFFSETNYEAVIEAIATANVVVLDSQSRLLGMLDLRPETKVIQLWQYMMPIQRFLKASMDSQDVVTKEISDILNLHGNYSYFPVASQFAKESFMEAFGSDEKTFDMIGSIHTDVLFDKKAKGSIIARLKEVVPGVAEGKKIIFYNPNPRKNKIDSDSANEFLKIKYMYEYLKNDYVLLYLYPKKWMKKINVPCYFNDFAVNLLEYPISGEGEEYEQTKLAYRKFCPEELMAVADIVIGDYKSETLNFLATGKPMFFYAPDSAVLYSIDRAFLDYYDLTKGMYYTDTVELAKAIQNIDNYDFERLKELKGLYCNNCDGKVESRVLKYIEEHLA